MRMSREAMAKHRQEIVAAAARMLRERGIEGTSVADIMQAAGLTHGGFYRHFASKEALVAEAAEAAYGDILNDLAAKSEKQGAVEAVAEYIAQYLSRRHVTKPGFGCPMAALGVEVAREGASVQESFANGTQGLLDTLSAGLTGTASERRAKAIRLLAMLVGAVVIARAVGDNRLGEEVLSACRETPGSPSHRKR
jgi:TetR/AcrR family transcriptional repressor of nem operon